MRFTDYDEIRFMTWEYFFTLLFRLLWNDDETFIKTEVPEGLS